MNLEAIDRNIAQKIQDELAEAAKSVFEKYGLYAKRIAVRYDSTDLKFTAQAAVKTATVQKADAYQGIHKMYGLKSDFIPINGVEYRLVKPLRGGKNWIALDRSNKEFKMPISMVQKHFQDSNLPFGALMASAGYR